MCSVHGSEKFILVSPIFQQNIYVGVYEQLKKNQSPIDFFHIDHEKFPFASDANFLEVTLHAGDCLYVPAYYFIQSQSVIVNEK